MRVRSLRLRNYRRFRDVLLELPDGLIAVTGPNGAGKSTLIESIAWCLFGHEASRTEKELIRHQGAATGEDVEARIEFELDQGSYAVTRRLRGRSQQTEAQVEADGALVVAPGANSSELASKYVARLLGMERRGFLSTVVANQGDLRALGDTKPGERKRLILSLLGIDEVDAAIAVARTRKREAAIRLDEMRRLLLREKDLQDRRSVLAAELSRSQQSLAQVQQELAQSAQRLHGLEERSKQLASQRQAHRELRARLEGLQRAMQLAEAQRVRLRGEIEILEEKTRELERLRAEGQRFEGLDARLERWEELQRRLGERTRLAKERQALEVELRRWEPHLSNGHDPESDRARAVQAREEADAIATAVSEAEAQARRVADDLARLQEEDARRERRHRELEALGSDAGCPTCERPLDGAQDALHRRLAEQRAESERRRAELLERRRTLQESLKELRSQVSAARARVQAQERALEASQQAILLHRTAVEETQRLRARAATLSSELERLPTIDESEGAALLAQRAQRDAWRERATRAETETARLPRLRAELAALAAQTEGMRRDVEAASRELHQLQYEEGSFERADRAEAEERARRHELDRRSDVLKERCLSLGAQHEQVERELTTLTPVHEEARSLAERVRVGELLAGDRGDHGLLPEFKTHLISRVRPALAASAGALVAQMTHGRYTELQIDEDYGITLFDRGVAWPLERFSGGENDVVHLAIRLAVSELLANARRARRLRFVALDEVLASQDEGRRSNVLHALRALFNHFSQVLLVTHLDEVRERVDHVIRVVPQADGTSRFVVSWAQKV